jgi:hypothetical protein
MSTIVKGFVTINAYVNNNPGVVSPLGELSTWSRTYSKEKGEYQSVDFPDLKLTTFIVADSLTGVPAVLAAPVAQQILQIVTSCQSYATSHIRPYDSVDFKNTILTNFFGLIGDLQLGEFRDNGSLALPDWISWISTSNGNVNVKIWLSDPAFQDQFDDFKIEVIPPVAIVDNLFNAYNIALTEVNARTSAQLSDKIQQIKGSNPETYLRLLDFNFINSLNTAQSNKTTWGVIIYGKTGDNIDSIKDAIVEYVLANSARPKVEWEVILPDVFKRTEFILLPRWDLISIENLGANSNLYSSALSPTEALNFAKTAINFYTPAFIDANTTVFPFDYKAISIIAVNGNTNVAGSTRLFDIFPDYIPVPSTSPDFNRMQLKTRDWMILLGQLLILAETATEFTSVPLYARKQRRNGILYISGMFDNVNYLVAAKSNPIFG